MTTQKSVLIVEDDQAIRNVMREALEFNGFEVITAEDGLEGIQRLQSLMLVPSLIILDMVMPRTTGWEFLDFQRAHPVLSAVPVLVCSAYLEIAKSVRASAVIEKPFSLSTFMKTVDRVCPLASTV